MLLPNWLTCDGIPENNRDITIKIIINQNAKDFFKVL